jgi:hypothetical protein
MPHAAFFRSLVLAALLVAGLAAAGACGSSQAKAPIGATSDDASNEPSDAGVLYSYGEAGAVFNQHPDGGGPLQSRIQVNGNGSTCGACVVLLAQTQGGIEPYSSVWSDPSLQGPGPFQICPQAPTTYSVTVTDSSSASGELGTGAQTVTAHADLKCTPSDGGDTGSLNGCVFTTGTPDGGLDAGGILECTQDEVDAAVAWADGGVVSATVTRVPGGRLLAGHTYQYSYDRLLPLNFGQPVNVDVFGATADAVCSPKQKLFSLYLDGSIFNWHQGYCFTPDRDYEYAITYVYIQGVLYYSNVLAAGTVCDTCSMN